MEVDTLKKLFKMFKHFVVLAVTLSLLCSVAVYVSAVDDTNMIKYDFDGSDESFKTYRESGATSTLSSAQGCLQIDFTGTSGKAAGFKTTKFTINRSFHNFINFSIKVPTDKVKFRIFMMTESDQVYTSWSEGNGGLNVVSNDGLFHTYSLNLDSANTHTTRPKKVADGTYYLRFDILMLDDLTVTQKAFVDWIVISEGLYSGDVLDFGGKTFFQKNESGMKELEYNEEKGCFVADDGLGMIGLDRVMPTDSYSMVMRYPVTEKGRYRIFGDIHPVDSKGDGTIIKIYKNNEIIKQGYFPSGQKGAIDIRLLANDGDIIDVEATIKDYVGHNYTEWSMNVSKVPSVVGNNVTSTVLGKTSNVVTESNLSDYLGSNKPENVKIYTTLYGVKHNMEYDSSKKRWQLNEKYVRTENINASDERERVEDMVWQNAVADNNYVSETQVRTSSNPVSNATTYIETPVATTGTILIDGVVNVASSEDGELVKLYLNNELLWSNRIGGETSNRYDEAYDNKYFIKDLSVVANVEAGDILKFGFNRWRLVNSNEYVDISDIKIKYVEGELLSKSTRWFLENSIVIDTIENTMYINGEETSSDVYIENGTTYISIFAAKTLFGNDIISDGNAYIPLRSVAESCGKNVVWTADRLIIIHDGIDGALTYNELSEIEAKTEIKGGDLFD